MFNIGPLELMVILLLALVVVGPSKLPEVGRSIGRALREFRKVQDEVRDSINFNLDAEPVVPRTPKKPGPPPAAVERERAAAAAAAGEETVDPLVDLPVRAAPELDDDELPVDPPPPAPPNGSTPAPEPPQD